jgi:hypothetical protein
MAEVGIQRSKVRQTRFRAKDAKDENKRAVSKERGAGFYAVTAVRSSGSLSAMNRPISSEAVAAGEGALQT